jgi:hypothetical protein
VLIVLPVVEVESEVVVELPPPQAANAPKTNTNNNFFIVSWFLLMFNYGLIHEIIKGNLSLIYFFNICK